MSNDNSENNDKITYTCPQCGDEYIWNNDLEEWVDYKGDTEEMFEVNTVDGSYAQICLTCYYNLSDACNLAFYKNGKLTSFILYDNPFIYFDSTFDEFCVDNINSLSDDDASFLLDIISHTKYISCGWRGYYNFRGLEKSKEIECLQFLYGISRHEARLRGVLTEEENKIVLDRFRERMAEEGLTFAFVRLPTSNVFASNVSILVPLPLVSRASSILQSILKPFT